MERLNWKQSEEDVDLRKGAQQRMNVATRSQDSVQTRCIVKGEAQKVHFSGAIFWGFLIFSGASTIVDAMITVLIPKSITAVINFITVI